LINNRTNKILKLINDKSLFGLEIGPSYNPVAPKREGWNIHIVDYLDLEELKKKYQAWGVNVDSIEPVDYIVGDEGLCATITKKNFYDYIIASHVIEHTPDPIKFLIDCESLLKKNGVLSLVVPDKRFCFDALKPLTTTGQVLQAHIEKRKRHPPGTIFDAYALHANKGGSIVWPGNLDHGDLTFAHSVLEAKTLMDQYILSGQYVDVHAWQFEYSSFRKIISDLVEMELINLKIDFESGSDGHEFYFSLRKQ
jgi:SAM-dependent methyltransferase